MNQTQTNNINNQNGEVNVNQDFSTHKHIDKSKTIRKEKGSGTKIGIKISIVLVAIIVLCYLVSIFINTPEKKIIGTWQINEEPQILVTFRKDGAFSMSGDGDYLDGNYTFLNNNTVQVHMNYMWADFIISGDISIKGKTMTVSNMSDPDDIFGADGATITLSKTK